MLKTLTGYWKTLLTLLAGGAVSAVLVADVLHVTPGEAAAIATLIAGLAVRFGPRNKSEAERSPEYKADSEAA